MRLSLAVFIAINMVFATTCLAQKTYRAKGEAHLRVEDQMSKDEARKKARQMAMIDAIEQQFGSYVEQQTDIELQNGITNFHIIGNTKVRGEWVKTLSENYKEEVRQVEGPKGKGYEVWIYCKMTGKIRELPKGAPKFEAWPLNCPQADCRSTAFYDEQPFYLHFKSPVGGQLSVFLREKDTVYRLLPYQSMTEPYFHAVPVEADKGYIFFSNDAEHDYFQGFDRYMTDELIMTAEADKEWVTLYIVFSENQYAKPVLQKARYDREYYGLPKSTHYRDFEEWLEENRLRDVYFIFKKIPLRIFRKN